MYDVTAGGSCTTSSQCASGFCVSGVCCNTACTDQCSSCAVAGLVGTCSPKTSGTSCSDGNACTLTDTCQGGTCTGGNPVTCTASDQCHVPGTCNTSTGTCSNPTAANGTACSDGNACTLTDTCQSGTCTGGNPVTCTASDPCYVAGTCSPSTGTCSNPTAANGTACSDGNACTLTDTCQSGTCTGGNPVTCTASDPCHIAGTCSPSTGTCSNPTAANGTACSDGNACTLTDTCQSGTCTGSNPVTCTASDPCHIAGTCSPSTGTCSNPTAANGTACSDGNACTLTDTCQTFAPQPNLTTTFSWDGTDAYGRLLQGGQPAAVTVSNFYNTSKYAGVDSFGLPANATLTTTPDRRETSVAITWNSTLEQWDDLPRGLGGWTLSVHHAYDPGAQVVHFGDGHLSAVADVAGNTTTINRDANGNPTALVSPYGQSTTLSVDVNGYLSAVQDPSGAQTQFAYGPQGLMATMTDPRGGLHQFSYDPNGRLTEDQDPSGGSKALGRTEIASGGFDVSITSALGVQSTYQTTTSAIGTFARLNTLPNGLQTSLALASTGVTTVTVPDGTTTTSTASPDPRFEMLSPLLLITTTTPSGLSSTRATTRSFTSSAGVLATWTEQTNLNGNTWTRLFNATAGTWTATSPLGRTTTTTVDAADRPTQIAIPGVAPFSMTYDSNGRLSTTTQGGNTWTNGYDSSGYLSSVTDALSHVVTYENDGVGRPTQTILQDGRGIGTSYDPDGNPTVITLPSPTQNAHDFAYTPVDLVSSYTPPSLGSGSTATSYLYNADRQPTTVTRPDGVALSYGYDPFGRLTGIAYPQGTLSRTYNPTTGQLSTLASPSGETLTYAYDGFLRTGITWSGPVAGSVSFGYDSNFRVGSQSINSANALMLGFDADSLLKQAGSLMVSRDPQNGRLTGTTLGSVTDTYGYDGNGLFASYVASYSGNAVYSESVIRDAVGRITQKTETIGGATHVFVYGFDPAGRLTDVTEDGAAVSHYGYDADDNRTTFTGPGGTVNPTYDAQDRLLTYGSASYAYTANGELTTKTVGAQSTGYTYDALGNLLHVGLPGGTSVDYVVDGENRRVGKELGGTLSQGFLYQDALNVVAQLDGSGNLVARFVFGTKPNVPDYYTTSAGTFRILSDHLGSPRLVVDTSSGNVVERIDYDEFGVVTQDTNPGLTPFGFAGGFTIRTQGWCGSGRGITTRAWDGGRARIR